MLRALRVWVCVCESCVVCVVSVCIGCANAHQEANVRTSTHAHKIVMNAYVWHKLLSHAFGVHFIFEFFYI